MSSWQQQALIEAPVEEVWSAVADPQAYAQWAADVIEVTGVAKLEPDSRFQQVTKTPFFPPEETTFRVEALEEMREVKLRCEKSGYYSRWVLTPAQDSTFMDVEIGIDPKSIQYRLYFGALGKRYFRRLTEQSLDGLRRAVAAKR
jgi:Polyketide cyclase / dehydrase and lipid transport